MRHLFLTSVTLIVLNNVAAQNFGIWKPVSSFGGGGRAEAVAFSISNKGYVGTGRDQTGSYNDFWEFDPVTNTWSQKASFGGTARFGAVGFAIGNKGYIGTGDDGGSGFKNDFWEYNPATNTWSQKATVPGGGRIGSVGFSIDSMGYIALGSSYPSVYLNSVYKYNPATNTWTQRSNFSGSARSNAMCATSSSLAYVGLGYDGSRKNDFWEYNPTSDNWSQKTNFGGGIRDGCSAFCINGLCYVGLGYDGNNQLDDFWVFDPSQNMWTPKFTFIARTGREEVVSFVVNNKAYFGTGYGRINGGYYDDFFEYEPQAVNPWDQRANVPGSNRTGAFGFSINTKGYIGGGFSQSDFWEFDPVNNTWSQKANLPGGAKANAAAFSLSGKGYVGAGQTSGGSPTSDFWEYTPATNQWVQKANVPGQSRTSAFSFSISTKGYIGAGSTISSSLNDVYEYNPATNQWSQKANFPGIAKFGHASFSINDFGYVAAGYIGAGASTNELWAYNPTNNTWVQKSSFPGEVRYNGFAFSNSKSGFVFSGTAKTGSWFYNDVWEYNSLTNSWIVRASFPGNARQLSTGFYLNDRGYFGTGQLGGGSFPSQDFWVFDPLILRVINTNKNSFCYGDSILIRYKFTQGNDSLFFQLSDSIGGFSPITSFASKIANSGYDSIKLKVPNSAGIGTGFRIRIVSSSDTSNLSDPITINGVHTTISTNKASFCKNDSAIITSITSTSFPTYLWLNGSLPIAGLNSASIKVDSSGYYRVLITDTQTGCKDTSFGISLIQYSLPKVGFGINTNGQCYKGNFFMFSDTTIGAITRVWNLGNNDTSSLINPLKSFTTAGSYTVKLVTTTNFGCKDSLSKTIVVYPQTTIAFSVNDSDQCKSGNNFVFTNSSSVSSGTFTNLWLFGNGDTSSQHSPAKSYTSAGTYNVQLITTTNNGCTDTLVKPVQVFAQPSASFTTDSTQCFNGNNFVMTNTSTGSPTAYHWDFGNSSTSTAATPSVSYSSVGVFPVRLVAINGFGCTDTVVHSVRVKTNPATPVVSYTPDTIACDNVNIVLKTNSTDTKSWLKNASPLGLNSDSLVVTNTPGAYSLKVTNSENCDAMSDVVNLFFKTTPAKPIVSVAGNVFTSSATTGNQWYNTTGAIAGQTAQTYLATSPGQYYTMVTLNACTSPASDMVNFPATGVASLSQDNGISVYPNPNNGSFTLVLDKEIIGPVLVKIFDLTGRLVFEEYKNTNDLSIQTNCLANGNYLVLVQTNDELYRAKVVINRL